MATGSRQQSNLTQRDCLTRAACADLLASALTLLLAALNQTVVCTALSSIVAEVGAFDHSQVGDHCPPRHQHRGRTHRWQALCSRSSRRPTCGDVLSNKWLLGITGALSIVFAILVSAQPNAGALTIVCLFGFCVILAGISKISVGIGMRGLGQSLQPRSQTAASPPQ